MIATNVENIDYGLIREARKLECEIDGLYFTRYFFKQRYGFKMLINEHHRLITDTLQKVIDGNIKRLIINVPPGYTKTELATINFIARGLAINPMARFLHLSYSDSLALENSSTARGIVKSEEYQSMWSFALKDDSDSKKKWWTEHGGGVYATSAGGQVTGFRAGHMDKGTFTGALIIDDPVKPDDAFYEERKRVNNRFNETIKSRLATEEVPIIVIMQRIHKDDLSGYLLKGGSNERWHHLNLPVKIDNKRPYNPEYTYGIPIKHGLKDGWLWPYKHSQENEDALFSHKRTYYCQYMQSPEDHNVEGALWDQDVIDRNRVVKVDTSALKKIVVGVDPSGDDGKEDSKADPIGIVVCGISKDGHYYLLEDCTMNGGPSEWAKKAVDLYIKYRADAIIGEKNYVGAMVENTIRNVPNGRNVYYKDVVASRGKLLRAEPVAALYEQNLFHHVGKFDVLEDQMTTFNGAGKSPNNMDALVWCGVYLSTNKTEYKTLQYKG